MAEQPKWRRDFPIDWAQDEYVSRRELVKFMVLTSAALTVGNSVGPALSGAVQDSAGPRWAFVVIGLAGAALSALALTGQLWLGRRPAGSAAPEPDRAALAEAKA